MVHNKFNTLLLGVVTQIRQIKIRVWGYKVKHLILKVAKPVLPANVPTLHQQSVKAVICGKINVAFHVGSVSAMTAVRLGVRVISNPYLNAREIICVGPVRLTYHKLPPHTHVFASVNP